MKGVCLVFALTVGIILDPVVSRLRINEGFHESLHSLQDLLVLERECEVGQGFAIIFRDQLDLPHRLQ